MKFNRLTTSLSVTAATLSVAGLMIAPAALATNATSDAVNARPDNCTLSSLYPTGGITVSGNKASAVVTVPANCQPVTLSLVSYSAPDANGYGASLEAQQLYDFQQLNSDSAQATENFSNVNVPAGCYQLDLVVGEKINSFANGDTYFGQDRLIASVNSCDTSSTPAPVVTPTPTPVSTPVVTPTATPTPGMGSGTTTPTPTATPVATVTAMPTVLPQTGAGLDGTSAAGIVAGLSGLGVAIRQRRRA